MSEFDQETNKKIDEAFQLMTSVERCVGYVTCDYNFSFEAGFYFPLELKNSKKALTLYSGRQTFEAGYRAALKDRAAVESEVLCQNNKDALTVQCQAEEIKELKRQLELSYSVLEMCGVPRERARSVQNGIMVLATRYAKEAAFQEEALKEQAKATQRKIADALEAIGQNPSAQMVMHVKIS